MKRLIDIYLDKVLAYAELPERRTAEIREELEDHLIAEVEVQREQGADVEQAALTAIRKMGPPELVGSRLDRKFRLIDIRARGVARGVIAIGPRAVGVFAFGGLAMGVVAVGGAAVGLISIGGVGLGLLLSWSGLAVSLISANGGAAVGLVAWGGLAIGVLGWGGLVIACAPLGGGVFKTWYPSLEAAPGWMQALQPILQVPTFINDHIVPILIAYVLVVTVSSVVQVMHEHRVRKLFRETWIFD